MDLLSETQKILRDGGYDTWPALKKPFQTICFESQSLIGFVFIFSSGQELLENWEKAQNSALSKYRPELKNAGAKAWNVYSIFLTEDNSDTHTLESIEAIEENFSQTRKISRGKIISSEALRSALLPLLPIYNRPVLDDANYSDRLNEALSDINESGAKAFLRGASSVDVFQILAEEK